MKDKFIFIPLICSGALIVFVFIIGLIQMGIQSSEKKKETKLKPFPTEVIIETTEQQTSINEYTTEPTTDKPTYPPTEPPTEYQPNLIFQNMGITIYCEGASIDRYGEGYVYIKVENHSGHDYVIQVRDFSINDIMIQHPVFSMNIGNGKTAYHEITIYESDLIQAGITEINEVECYFTIFNFDDKTYDFDTEKIKFKP